MGKEKEKYKGMGNDIGAKLLDNDTDSNVSDEDTVSTPSKRNPGQFSIMGIKFNLFGREPVTSKKENVNRESDTNTKKL